MQLTPSFSTLLVSVMLAISTQALAVPPSAPALPAVAPTGMVPSAVHDKLGARGPVDPPSPPNPVDVIKGVKLPMRRNHNPASFVESAAMKKLKTVKGKAPKKLSHPPRNILFFPVGNKNKKEDVDAHAVIRLGNLAIGKRTVNEATEEGNKAGLPAGAGEKTAAKDEVNVDKPNFPQNINPIRIVEGKKDEVAAKKPMVGRAEESDDSDDESDDEDNGNRRIAMAHAY